MSEPLRNTYKLGLLSHYEAKRIRGEDEVMRVSGDGIRGGVQ